MTEDDAREWCYNSCGSYVYDELKYFVCYAEWTWVMCKAYIEEVRA